MNTIDQDIITPLLEWYDQNKRILPWRGSKDPYRIWVSEIMLQQTRVEAVKPYYERFMTELCDIKSLAHAREERLLKLWEGLGYYNRVRNMQKAAIQIEERFDGVFPRTYDEIQSLPGIGSYTAGAIASIAFGEAVPAVDGNVLRIISRLILYEEDVLSQKAKNEVRDMLLPFMNVSGRSGDINQAFMELGATVCVPNGAPHCEKCPWKDMCLAKSKDIWQEYPRKAAKKARRMEKRTILIVGDEDHALDQALGHHVLHHLDDHFLTGDIQCRGGFIGNQHLGIQNGGNRNDHALAHAARQFHAVLVQCLHRQAQKGKPLLRHFADLLAVHGQFMCPYHILNKLAHFPGRIQCVHGRLRNIGHIRTQNRLADHIRIQARNRLSVDDDFTAGVMKGREIVSHQAECQGGFAAAGFTGNAQAFTFLNVQ